MIWCGLQRCNAAFGVVVLFVGLVLRVAAQPNVYTLSTNNSLARIAPNSQAGLLDWEIGASDFGHTNYNPQLKQQWFWYRVGSDAQQSIDTISHASVAVIDPANISVSYLDSQGRFDLSINYTLTGGALGSGQSDIFESIAIHNHSATSPLDFHLYLYSDFNLLNEAAGDSVHMYSDNGPGEAMYHVEQSKQFDTAQLQALTLPTASHGEAGSPSDILNELNGNTPLTLSDVTDAGPGDEAWALQWDLSIDPDVTTNILFDSQIYTAYIPEPSVTELILAAMFAAIPWRLSRRSGLRSNQPSI